MKGLVALIGIIVGTTLTYSQSINWSTIENEDRHIVSLGFGYDFGTVAEVSYAFKFRKLDHTLLRAGFSTTMGDQIADDLTLSLGLMKQLFARYDFSLAGALNGTLGICRSTFVNILGFGTDASLEAGYYQPRWFVATELGYRSVHASRLEHHEYILENYPAIQNGWYTHTSAYLYLGGKLGTSFSNGLSLSMNFGYLDAKGNDSNSVLPYYVLLNFNLPF